MTGAPCARICQDGMSYQISIVGIFYGGQDFAASLLDENDRI